VNPGCQITFGSWLVAPFLFYGKVHIASLIHVLKEAPYEKNVAHKLIIVMGDTIISLQPLTQDT
jgi:hypothetical protein